MYAFLADGQGQLHAPVQQHLKKQVFRRTTGLDIIRGQIQQILLQGVRRIEHIRHIGGIHLEHAETHIPVPAFMAIAFQDFLSGPADALLADLGNGAIARFGGFACSTAGFRQLHHNETPIAAVLGIELHHRMGCSGRTGEEIEAKAIISCHKRQKSRQKLYRFWIRK